MDNTTKLSEQFTEILFLTRELRFAVSLVQSALEETEKFDLVINDPSCLMFLLLASQGIERLLKLVLSYDTIINDKFPGFSPKKSGHKIDQLYKQFSDTIITPKIKQNYDNLFGTKTLESGLFIKFTNLLEVFNTSGRYYFTSQETRRNNRFDFYFDEKLVHLISEFERIKIFNKYKNMKKYSNEISISVDIAKNMNDDFEPLIPGIFCKAIEKDPIVPFWDKGPFGKMSATDNFKSTSREFLLIYISPIIAMLEEQFIKIGNKYNKPYYFSELTISIRYSKGHDTHKLKKHRNVSRDVYSTILL